MSADGLNWDKAQFVDLQEYTEKWWSAMRTPLGLIPEKDGTFTTFFTAYTTKDDTQSPEGGFAEIGKVSFRLIEMK